MQELDDFSKLIDNEFNDSLNIKEFIVFIFTLNVLKKYSLLLDEVQFDKFKIALINFLENKNVEISDDIRKLITDFKKVDEIMIKNIIDILEKKMTKYASIDSHMTEIFARERNQWEKTLGIGVK